jgi:hypothetical protein
MSAPNKAGIFLYSDSNHNNVKIVVEESATSGRFCRSLKLGGCNLMGFGQWPDEASFSEVSLTNKKVITCKT